MLDSKTEEDQKDQYKINVFGSELKRQCTFALIAMENAFGCLQKIETLDEGMLLSRQFSPMKPENGDIAKFMENRKKEMEVFRKEMDKFKLENDVLSNHLWYSLQNFLVAVGNISKIFWVYPKDGDAPTSSEQHGMERAEKLRKIYLVDEEPPYKSRKFRNHFEHFDQRIDDWATSSTRKCFVDSNICPKGSIVGMDQNDEFRNLDPQTFTLTFAGKEYELLPVYEAIKELHQIVIGKQQEQNGML